MSINYGPHPSRRLAELFRSKPYQGANPETASIIVLGNDANYSPEISRHPFFQRILEYHADGVGFWKRYRVHHPFLHAEYPFAKNRAGVTYHRNFSKLGLDQTFAEKVSFVELLNVPTIGNTGANKKLFYDLMDLDHLAWLEDLILTEREKFVLVNQTLVRSITTIHKRLGAMSKLRRALGNGGPETVVYISDTSLIYNGYSFSHTVTNLYLEGLSKLIRRSVLANSR